MGCNEGCAGGLDRFICVCAGGCVCPGGYVCPGGTKSDTVCHYDQECTHFQFDIKMIAPCSCVFGLAYRFTCRGKKGIRNISLLSNILKNITLLYIHNNQYKIWGRGRRPGPGG